MKKQKTILLKRKKVLHIKKGGTKGKTKVIQKYKIKIGGILK